MEGLVDFHVQKIYMQNTCAGKGTKNVVELICDSVSELKITSCFPQFQMLSFSTLSD